MDEYSILKKKQKKNAFVATALLISIAIALLVMVGAVLVLSKVNDNDYVTASDDAVVEKETTTENKNASTCEGLVKEIVFNDNLRNIKEAAVSYFTNERLPQTIGDTEKITLKTMIDKKLIRTVRDASANTCSDTKSYVEVTKEKDEYVMKIFLSCTDLEDYIIVHLGCYDYCDKDVCEKEEKIFEYEYKKTTSCVMSDWSNWGNWKTTREKISNLKKEDTKVETSTKEVTNTINATKVTTYNCDNYPGYALVGTKCVKESTITDTKDATKNPATYNCNSYPGYTLSGTKCVKTTNTTDVKDATKNAATYNCNSYPGYTLSGTKCVKTTNKTETKNASVSYNCNSYSGYKLSGTKCVKTTSSTVEPEVVYGTKYRTEKFTCYKDECTTKTVFSCPVGKSCGNYPETSCEKVKKTCTKQVAEKYVAGYECKDSSYTLVENKDGSYSCTKSTTDTKDATIEYNCEKGYTKEGTKCTKVVSVTDTKDATKNAATYNCNSYAGYTLNGTKCTKGITVTDTKEATKNPDTYNCNSYAGYTLNGTKCTKAVSVTDVKDATKNPDTYNCNNYTGYTLTGNKCVKTSSVADAKNANVVTTYTCPSGYTKNNTTCSKKGTETVKTTYYRYATRTCNGGSTSTEWSTSNNDSILKAEGYKLTGKKREVKEIVK